MHHSNRTVALDTRRALLLGGAALLACSSHAQTPASEGQSGRVELEEIVVTGTHLRGVEPVGSAVISIGRDEIEAVGANTTAQILQLQPQVFNLGISETQRTGTGGAGNITYATAINLRGLSPFATLTLINGHRAPPTGTVGAAVDPSVIPTIMLQNVDIVADGASATYGSDAIAGVVNLIMRRNFSGAEAGARVGWGDHYSERQYNGVIGTQWDGGQFTLGAEYSKRSALNGRHRDFYSADLSRRGGADNRLNSCSPGTLVVDGVTYAIPAGGVTPATAHLLVPNTENKCDTIKMRDLLPEQERYSAAFTFDHRITDAINVFADGYFSRRDFQRRVPFVDAPLMVTSANPYFVAPPGTNATSATVNFWFGNQGLGDTWTSEGFSENYQGTLGFEVDLPGNWKWQVLASYGHNEDESRDVSINTNSPAVQEALASTDPARALNLFGPNSAAVLAPLHNDLFLAPGESAQYVYETKVDGPLFSLPGGEVRAALGYQRQKDTLINGLIQGTVENNAPAFGGLIHQSRTSDAFYGEVLIPIVGPDNGVTGIRNLDLIAGIRTTDYTIVGRTTNPKFGVTWDINESVQLHASYGRSFRAPGLSQLKGPLTAVFVQAYATPDGPVMGYTTAGGNTELQPEKATTWSVGGDWTPSFAPDFKLTLNYFDIDFTNQITSYLSDTNILQDPEKYASIITPCPSAQCTALIDRYILGVGPNPRPLPLFGPLLPDPGVFVNGFEQNLGSTHARGIDFDVRYALTGTASGNWTFGLSGTRFLDYDVAFTPGAPEINLVNYTGYPLRLRMRGTLGWQHGAFGGMLFVNYQNAYTNNLATPYQRISSQTTADLFFNVNVGDLWSQSWLSDTRLGLNVTNLFDEDPPFANLIATPNGGGGYDPATSSPIGRVISISLNKKW
jgi:iron complex outermembrane receptor protein